MNVERGHKIWFRTSSVAGVKCPSKDSNTFSNGMGLHNYFLNDYRCTKCLLLHCGKVSTAHISMQ